MEYQYASANNSRDIECANPGWGSTFFSECANPGWGSTFFPECVLNIMEDQCASTNNSIDIECADPITEDGVEDNLVFDGRKICKLFFPKELKKISEEDYYTPQVVSFGPYYHGRPEFRRAEELKREILEMQISSSSKVKVFGVIRNVIDIRNCYVGVSEDTWDDGALTEMMLLDASFAAFIMMDCSKESRIRERATSISIDEKLGYNATPSVRKDMLLLDNQIPLWVIMRFFKLIFDNEEDGREILYAFVNRMARLHNTSSIPGEDEKPPLHLLDAIYRVLVPPVKNCECKISVDTYGRSNNPSSTENRQFRSVTDLKAKGINFEPSSQCLNDIDFKPGIFSGDLQLPPFFFNQYSKLLFINLVAYELHPQRLARPESSFPGAVASYVNFLKSLVIKPEDVRELRERKILFSSLNGDEKVLQAIKDISSARGDSELEDVKMSIEAHCSNYVKTTVGELMHTYFPNLWTKTAVLSATALLVLTFFQTYYTMKYHN